MDLGQKMVRHALLFWLRRQPQRNQESICRKKY
jgi:hypothetical protein